MNINTSRVMPSSSLAMNSLARELKAPQLIDLVDIKAILYLCLQGDLDLPEQEHQLDIQI